MKKYFVFFLCNLIVMVSCFSLFVTSAVATDVSNVTSNVLESDIVETSSNNTKNTTHNTTTSNDECQLVIQAKVDPRVSGDVVVSITGLKTGKGYTTTLYKHDNYTSTIRIFALDNYAVTLCEVPDNWDFRYKIEYAHVNINPKLTNYLYFNIGDPDFKEVLDADIDQDGDGWADDESHGIFSEEETEPQYSYFDDENPSNKKENTETTVVEEMKTASIVIIVLFFILLLSVIGISVFIYYKKNQNY